MSLTSGTLSSNLKEHLVHVQNAYWNIRGTQRIRQSGASAVFDAGTDDGGDLVRWMSKHESVFLDELLSELEVDDVLWDVGANLGVFTCLAMDALPAGHVCAFEPYSPNVGQLRENVGLNTGSADVFHVALSDENGEQEFFFPDTDTVGYQRSSLEDNLNPAGETVTTRRGDSLIADEGVPSPTVVKIDVEGAEGIVVDGLEETLSKDTCRLVLCEVHLPTDGRPSIEDFGSTDEELRSTLCDAEFEVEVLVERGDEILLKATK